MSTAFLGVGNPLRRDDGVGHWVGRQLATQGRTVYLAGPTPENILGQVQRDTPDTLVVVDAAELGLPPGSFRRLPQESTPAMLTSTHGLPLTFLLSLLRNSARSISLIGVQPALLEAGEGLTSEVRTGAESLVKLLAAEDFTAIPLHDLGAARVDRTAPRGEH
ncbi:MAG: hydrogenase maturation protease [Candidatus Bipolaricaulota bacterium]